MWLTCRFLQSEVPKFRLKKILIRYYDTVVQFKAYVVHNYIKTGVFCVITDQSALLEHTGV